MKISFLKSLEGMPANLAEIAVRNAGYDCQVLTLGDTGITYDTVVLHEENGIVILASFLTLEEAA